MDDLVSITGNSGPMWWELCLADPGPLHIYFLTAPCVAHCLLPQPVVSIRHHVSREIYTELGQASNTDGN